MIWQVPQIWEGGDVFILGGGPSIIKQFDIPESLVMDVLTKKKPISVYSEYLSLLHNKHVIGVNTSFLIGEWVDFIFFGDNGFLLQNQCELAEHIGLKISCHPQTEKYNWIKYVCRDKSKVRGISTNPKAISWNGNSGASAINIAIHTGAKRIILLGFDMKLDDSKKQHWHNHYNKYGQPVVDTRHKRHTLPFDRHLRGFPEIAKDAKKIGVEILNANPDSAIDVFKKINVKDIL